MLKCSSLCILLRYKEVYFEKSIFFLLNFLIMYVILNLKKLLFGSRIKKILNESLKELTIFKMTRKLIFLFFAFL